MCNKLLDKCNDKFQSAMKQKLNDKTVTMQQGSWSTVQNDPVTATSVVCEGICYFVDAKDTGTTHMTAEACKSMFESSRLMLRILWVSCAVLCNRQCKEHGINEEGVRERK